MNREANARAFTLGSDIELKDPVKEEKED